MFSRIFNRFRRAPLSTLSVILLAAVLSASLCALHAANIAEQARYDETVENVEVKLVVTNLSATRSVGLEAPAWVDKVFTSRLTDNGLLNYVKDVQIRAIQGVESTMVGDGRFDTNQLVGITGFGIAPELNPGGVTWFDGYDESLFSGKEKVCLVPESALPEGYDGTTPLTAFVTCYYYYWEFPYTTTVEMTVAGTYSGQDGNFYCPYKTVTKIQSSLSNTEGIDAIQATLIDNSMIEEVREVSKAWFAKPNPTGEKTPWRYIYYFYYPYALDIDNDRLVEAEQTLKISILINELCAVLVFALSAGASFFVGFLMIRSRKREIALMRTLGTPVPSVFLNLALEQLLCLAAGTAIGGGFFGFEPPERLVMFAAVYFTGLCLALVIFLGKNLMTTLKEDE